MYIYIYGETEINPVACECTNIKKQIIQKMILFIVELFLDIKCFGYYIKPSSRQLICDVSSDLYLILLFKMKWKNEPAFNIQFLLMVFCFKIVWCN